MGNSVERISTVTGKSRYFFSKGFRVVYPYYWKYERFAKERWLGKTLHNIITEEWSFYKDREFLFEQVGKGKLLINQKQASLGQCIQSGDFMNFVAHVHEPPVTSEPIKILSLTDEFLVVNKPSSIPVHPCGRFNFNSVIEIVKNDHPEIGKLYTVHRLDRHTSGLLILPRNEKTGRRVSNQIQKGEVQKVYFAKVIGKFPSHEVTVNQPIVTNLKPMLSFCHAEGKESVTHFQLMDYDTKTDSSIVKCLPKTGRTHQIRVHLQWLGYPILEDPYYTKLNPPTATQIPQSNEEKGYSDPDCPECRKEFSNAINLPLYLHCYSYQGKDWEFKSSYPPWYQPEGQKEEGEAVFQI